MAIDREGGAEVVRERLPIPSTSPAERVIKRYDHSLKRNPMFVSKVVRGSLQSSQLY